jgi:indole-3-acetate monooxygenase
MTSTTRREVATDPLAAAAALGPRIAAEAPETERRGRLSDDLWTEIREAGLLRMWLPAEIGGTQVDLPRITAACEEVARHDGSAGWVTMIGSGTNYLMTSLREDVVRRIFEPDPDISSAGLLVPLGRARRTASGYHLSGRWPFGSGCEHSHWMIGGAVVVGDDGGPETDAEGRPVTTMLAFPTTDVTIHPTWNVSGLHGTGSHDYEVIDLFVPADHAFVLTGDRTAFAFPHAYLPFRGALASQAAAVLLGMARGALDALLDQIAGADHRSGAPKDRPLLQARIAHAEASIRSARSFLYDAVDGAWANAVAQEAPTLADDFALRLASSHAARASTEVAELTLTAGGTASLYAESPVQRFHRDIHVAQQHGIIAYYTFEELGRDLLRLNQARHRGRLHDDN